MKDKIINLLKSETGLYIVFGVLTTVVNYIVFVLFSFVLGYEKVLLVNTISFLVAVAFAYITNKLYVFKSPSFAPKVLLKEISAFLSARIFSYILEQIGLYISVDLIHLEAYSFLGIDAVLISKAFLNVIVILLNYIFSKFIIFKKK